MSEINTTQLYIPNATEFAEDWHVRVTWIAFMTLWVFWGLVWTVRSYFVGDATKPVVTEPDAAATTADAETAHKKFGMSKLSVNSGFAGRIERGYRQVTEALFSLVCLLTLNTFARASTRAVMIIAWFYLAFAVVWYIAELVTDNRYVRVLYTVIYYGLGLTIAGLAFKQGFF